MIKFNSDIYKAYKKFLIDNIDVIMKYSYCIHFYNYFQFLQIKFYTDVFSELNMNLDDYSFFDFNYYRLPDDELYILEVK